VHVVERRCTARGTWLEERARVRLVTVCFVVCALAACEPPGYGKHDHVDAAADSGGAGDGQAPLDGGGDAQAATCDHAFRLDGHATAASVWLTGDFVSWAANPSAGAVAMTLGNDGGWTVTHTFPAGAIQYKFIVDGSQWIPDPTNPNQVDDGFGSHNSLYTCAP
jgi:hypothetical protein